MPTAIAFDWTGNQTSIFSTLAASNHSKTERQADDYYATDPIAVEKQLQTVHTLSTYETLRFYNSNELR